jgi:hypothetical protein
MSGTHKAILLRELTDRDVPLGAVEPRMDCLEASLANVSGSTADMRERSV